MSGPGRAHGAETATEAGRGAAPPSPTPLVFAGVSHWYGPVVAVNDISFTVGPGITGLLGPNGAGKSTVLALAAGVLAPSSGSVRVFGAAPAGRAATYAQVALVPEREALPGMLTARQFVEARAAMLGLPQGREAARAALAMVELDAVADRRVGGFSKGMRQRVKLAAALVHGPSLVLLDEPFNGLDPRQRLQMLRLLQARAEAGVAVVLSSHILEEIEGVAPRILVMLAGRLAATGDYRTLRRLMTDRPHTIAVRSSDDRALGAALLGEAAVLGVELRDGRLSVRTRDWTALARALAPTAQRLGITVTEVQPLDESLEHVFAYLVQR